MSWFSRPNQMNEFAEAIRPELVESPVPAPGAELFERIVASRNSGTRVILPDVAQAPDVARRRFLIPALVAAALMLMITPFRRSERAASFQDDPSSLSRIANDWLPGSVAFAQTGASRFVPEASPMAFTSPGKLRPMRLQYLRTWRDSAKREVGRASKITTVERIVRDGVPAFLVVTRNEGARNGHGIFTIDSVAVAQANLRLLRHTALERPYGRYDQINIEQRFHGDSIVGGMRATLKGALAAQRPIARRLVVSSDPYLVDALALVMFGTMNLRPGWSGSALVVGWAVRDDDVVMPVEARVDGEEIVSVPAGRFDCWRLSIRVAGGLATSWARKSDGVLVRTVAKEDAGTTREAVLVKATP